MGDKFTLWGVVAWLSSSMAEMFAGIDWAVFGIVAGVVLNALGVWLSHRHRLKVFAADQKHKAEELRLLSDEYKDFRRHSGPAG